MIPDLLLVGHVTADIKPEGRVLGGTVSYAARVAHGFGLRVAIVTSAAVGEPLLAQLSSVAELAITPADTTTTFENVYIGTRRQQTLHGCAQRLQLSDVPMAWRNAPLVHLAPVADELSDDLFGAFSQHVMLTPQGLMRQWGADRRVHFKRWFEPELLQSVDLAVFSQQDIEGDQTLQEAFVEQVTTVVTDGAAGGIAYVEGQATPYEPFIAQEVDPTGAGDVFATSLMIALYHYAIPFQRSLAMAAHVAAITVQHPGVYTPTHDELSDIVALYT